MRVVVNPAIGELLKRHRGLIDPLGDKAEAVADEARRIAPVESGRFRNSIEAQAGIEDQVKGRVVSNDPKARYLERGTEDTPRFATFKRAAATVLGPRGG